MPHLNVNLTHALLAAASEKPYGFLKVRSSRLVREVEIMAEAGLVEFSLADSEGETFAVINRVTDSGRAFLRTWKDKVPQKIAELASS
jgi:DNA-binding MarR family transcriptional regulator